VAQETASANGRDVILPIDHAFPILDPNVRNPRTKQWEHAVRLSDLVL
jgi:hypothetical protein